MARIRSIEPIYQKTPAGLVKIGTNTIEIVTSKAGEVLSSTIVRQRLYKTFRK